MNGSEGVCAEETSRKHPLSLERRRKEWDTNVDSGNMGMWMSGEASTVNAINQRVFSGFALDALNSIQKS